MTQVKLKCVLDDCDYETTQLDFEHARSMLDLHMRYAHPTGEASGGVRKPEKFPRPEIKLDSSAEDWSEFLETWKQYKEEYALQGAGLIRQLFAACSDVLKHSLSRSTGGSQFSKSEQQLLDLMKQLAVRYQNPAVHVLEFLGLSQQQDEGVRHYLTRLRGVASRCNFTQKCECEREVSYADSVIRFKLIAGLYDTEIKEDILSAEDISLDETVKAIEAKESGKLARKTVGVVHDSAPSRVRFVEQDQPTCGHCNRTGHSSSQADREKFCPAYNKNCSICDKKGHFRVACRSKSKQPRKKAVNQVFKGNDSENLDCTFANQYLQLKNDQSAEINSISLGELAALRYSVGKITREIHSINKVKVPHMLFDQLKWVTSHPPAAQFIKLKVDVDTKAYIFNSIKPPSAYKHRTAVIEWSK